MNERYEIPFLIPSNRVNEIEEGYGGHLLNLREVIDQEGPPSSTWTVCHTTTTTATNWYATQNAISSKRGKGEKLRIANIHHRHTS
jgi:hypothetical protein